MRAIGRGLAATVIAGCVALAGTPGAVAETLDEQPIAVPEQEAPAPTEAAAGQALAVRDVRIETTDAGRRMVVALSREPDSVQNFQLSGPPRLVVDLQGPLAWRTREARFTLSDSGVTRVRVAPYEGQLRIVFDLKSRGAVTAVRKEGTTLIADLAPLPAATAKTVAAPAPSPTAVGSNETSEAPRVLAAVVDATSEPAAAPIEPAPTPAVAPTAAIAAVPAPRAEQPRREKPAPPRTSFDDIGSDGPTIEPVAAYVPNDEPAGAQPARLAPARTRDTVAPAPQAPVFTGQKISLDFKDADIQNVLRVLADVSGLNIIATDDVQGKVT